MGLHCDSYQEVPSTTSSAWFLNFNSVVSYVNLHNQVSRRMADLYFDHTILAHSLFPGLKEEVWLPGAQFPVFILRAAKYLHFILNTLRNNAVEREFHISFVYNSPNRQLMGIKFSCISPHRSCPCVPGLNSET